MWGLISVSLPTFRYCSLMTFHCRQCNSPIALDDSLKSLSKGQIEHLLKKSEQNFQSPAKSPEHYIPHDRLELANQALSLGDTEPHLKLNPGVIDTDPSKPHLAYVYVSDSEIEGEHNHTLGELEERDGAQDVNGVYGEGQLPEFSKVKSLRHVFEILSTNQDVEFPMCVDCAQLLTQNYKLKFDQSQREKDYYMSFLKKMKDTRPFSDANEASLDKEMEESTAELRQLEALQKSKLGELESLETAYDDLNSQLDLLARELEHLNVGKLEEVAKLRNSLNLELNQKQGKLDQAKALYQKQLDHLDQLRSLNIFTELFTILFDKKDNWGRINSFRLGYRVPWPEVNAALGQIVLLLIFLQKRFSVNLGTYKLVPMGSKSYIVKEGSAANQLDAEPGSKAHSVLPLYSTNEFTLGKLFNFNKLDVSMMAMLDILSQFEARLTSIDGAIELPYKISSKHDTIGTRSIRATSNAQWTEACRYLLIDLNWMLSYASAQ